MWDLPRPGLEPMSPALAGGFLTTAPPGKPLDLFLFDNPKVSVGCRQGEVDGVGCFVLLVLPMLCVDVYKLSGRS